MVEALKQIILAKITHIGQNPPWRDKAAKGRSKDLEIKLGAKKKSNETKELEEVYVGSSRQFPRQTANIHLRALEQHRKLSIANLNESLRQSLTTVVRL